MPRFANDETEDVFSGITARHLPHDIQRRARMRLQRVVAAVRLKDLRVPPSHRLERLRGDRTGSYSIRITTNGAYVSFGRNREPWKSRSPITTEEEHIVERFDPSGRTSHRNIGGAGHQPVSIGEGDWRSPAKDQRDRSRKAVHNRRLRVAHRNGAGYFSRVLAQPTANVRPRSCKGVDGHQCNHAVGQLRVRRVPDNPACYNPGHPGLLAMEATEWKSASD